MALLLLQDLGLSLDDLTLLTGESSDALANFLLGVKTAPNWLVMLAIFWSENPGALERSREMAILLSERSSGNA